jgi:plasmid stabilization system protein ParE
VRVVEWTQPALADFEAFLDELDGHDQRIADRAEHDIRSTISRLADHPQYGHKGRWPGLLQWSATRWRKIIVYRERPDGLRVIAFLDTRRDLSVIDLSET